MNSKTITREQLAGMFDHTLLKAYATKEDFRKLCNEAKELNTESCIHILRKSCGKK